MKRLVACIGLALVACGMSSPANAGFSRGGPFVAPGYGARAWGMAGAAVAYGSDEGATYWNPALLSLMTKSRLGLSYVNLVPGTEARHSYIAYARAVEAGAADEPTLEFAKHAFGALYGNLLLELSDGQKYTENTLLLAYAYSPEYFVSIGASLGLLLSSSDVAGFDAKGTTVNVGVRVVLLERLTLGVMGRSLFSRIMFDTGEDYVLERAFTLGLAYRLFQNATIEGDAVSAYGGISRLAVGAEATFFSDLLALRAGVSDFTAGESRVVPHMGIGISYRRIHLDYNANFDTNEAFENTHRFSLAIGL